MGHESGHSLPESSAQVSQGCNQGVVWAVCSSEGLTEEGSIPKLIGAVGRIHFLWSEDSGPGFLLAVGCR